MNMTFMRAMHLAAVLALATPGWAQSARESVLRGISSYRALEYEAASAHFRAALAVTGGARLTGPDRVEALTYLGAAEQLRGNSTAAADAFVSALAIDARYRMDRLLFPPPVTRAFDAARAATAYSVITPARDTTFSFGSRIVIAHVHTSAPHDVVVTLERANGEVIRELFSGRVDDSAAVEWNGAGNAADVPLTGGFSIHARPASSALNRGDARLQFAVNGLPVDTLNHPPRPVDGTPARVRTHTPGVQALALGVLAGATVIILPNVIGDQDKTMTGRYVLGAGLSGAGVLGFISARRDARRDRDAALASARAVETWRGAVERIRGENERRRASPNLRITFTRNPGGTAGG